MTVDTIIRGQSSIGMTAVRTQLPTLPLPDFAESESDLISNLFGRLKNLETLVERKADNDQVRSLIAISPEAIKLQARDVVVQGAFTVMDLINEQNGTTNGVLPARITRIVGDRIRTGIIQSNNYSGAAGTAFDLNTGQLIIGGTDNPKLLFDPTDGNLTISGRLTADSLVLTANRTLGQISADAAGALPADSFAGSLQGALDFGVNNIIAGMSGDYRLLISTTSIIAKNKDANEAGLGAGYVGDIRTGLIVTGTGIGMGFNRKSDGVWVNAISIASTGDVAILGTLTAGSVITGSVTVDGVQLSTTRTLAAAALTPASDLDAGNVIGQLTNDQIAAIAAAKITGTLTNTQIADLAAAKLTGQIITTQITDGAISSAKISAGSVTAGKIAALSIVAGDIAANAISSAKISAGAITAGKIAALSIVAGDIAANAITTAKIGASQVVAGSIATNAITSAKISAGAITAGKIAAGTIVAGDIAANTITVAELAAGTLSAANITSGTLAAGVIYAGDISAATGTFSGNVDAAHVIATGSQLIAGIGNACIIANPSDPFDGGHLGWSKNAEAGEFVTRDGVGIHARAHNYDLILGGATAGSAVGVALKVSHSSPGGTSLWVDSGVSLFQCNTASAGVTITNLGAGLALSAGKTSLSSTLLVADAVTMTSATANMSVGNATLTGNANICIKEGAVGTRLDNQIQIYGQLSGDADTTLGIVTEQDVVAGTGAFTGINQVKIHWNGVAYWLPLQTV